MLKNDTSNDDTFINEENSSIINEGQYLIENSSDNNQCKVQELELWIEKSIEKFGIDLEWFPRDLDSLTEFEVQDRILWIKRRNESCRPKDPFRPLPKISFSKRFSFL